jgi:hypothetical protein
VRRWTRLGTVAIAAHVFYELTCGVAMPLASVVGPLPAGVGWAGGATWLYRADARKSRTDDGFFAVLNGVYLSAVIAHYAAWPKHWRAGMPLLRECEGLRGAVMVPYHAILWLSGIAAVGGLYENRRATKVGAALPVVLVPLLVSVQRWEFNRLRVQARRHPAWWNRRLQPVLTD